MDVETAHPPSKPADSFHSDEKFDKKHGAVEIAEPILGDVYDDVRAIDLVEDGHALSVRGNPFGGFISELRVLPDTDVDISTRLISLESRG
jgi:hypothetical protein